MRDSKHVSEESRPLASFVAVDPESLPMGTAPNYTFRYIDIASATQGRLLLPDDEIEYRDAPSRARRVLCDGDVIMSTVRPNLKAFAYCRLPPGNFIASTGFAVLRSKAGTDPRFILYSILSEDVTRQIERFVVGSNYPAINSSDVKRLLIPNFSPGEQERVGEIIGTVDEAIEQTEALIAKTQQIKAGLMHDLFTRGVTADGQLRPPRKEALQLYKESPLGWIPKEWEVATIGAISELVTSGSRGWAAYYADEGALFVRIGNLTREHPNLRLEDVVRVQPPVSSEGARTRLVAGDVLISITADLGITGVIPAAFGEAYINQHIALVRPQRSLEAGRWLGHWLGGARAQAHFRRLDDSGAKAGLNLPTIRSFPGILPPKTERDAIVRTIDALDDHILDERETATKLQVLKRGLMHDLLTGRVSVAATANASIAEVAANV